MNKSGRFGFPVKGKLELGKICGESRTLTFLIQ